jgi:hypothetical protein
LLGLNPHTKIRQHGCFTSVSVKIVTRENENKKAFPAFKYLSENPSIAVTPKSIIDESSNYFDTYRSKTPMLPDFGVWVAPTKTSELPLKLPAFSILL